MHFWYFPCFILIQTCMSLKYDWQLSNLNHSIFLQNLSLPNCVHSVLLANGIIDSPLYRYNEILYQWIANETWTWSTNISTSNTQEDTKLVLNGIDTVGTVYFNDKAVLRVDNMFREYQVELPKLNNVAKLSIQLEPVLLAAKARAMAYSYDIPSTVNFNTWTEPSYRAFVRKSGMSFGWDFAPAIVSIGIYHVPKWIQASNLCNMYMMQHHFKNGSVLIKVRADTKVYNKHMTIRFTMNGNVVLQHAIFTNAIKLRYVIQQPRLWWPRGYGEPYLYNCSLQLWHLQDMVAYEMQTLGVRHVELVQGTSFYFRMNSRRIFVKGANKVPTNVLPSKNKQDIDKLLNSVVLANMNMLRIWGGGEYESSYFYQKCDALGIMVWQEFMFACSMYPRNDAFLNTVREEITYQVRRLRQYASIVIWGGNNENESIMDQFARGWFVTKPFNRDVFIVDYAKLYIDTVLDTLNKHDHHQRPFVDTSPSNGIISTNPYVKRWGDSSNGSMGDVHFYNYSCDCQQNASYPTANFVSEFGFQSLSSYSTLRSLATEDDMHWDSKLMKFWQRHENGTQQMVNQILRHFVSKNTHFYDADFRHQIYLTQLQQAECYKTAITKWRMHNDTGGVLYWMLNDVWQGPTWSSLEMSGKWKLLHYYIQQLYANVYVSMQLVANKKLAISISNHRNRFIGGTIIVQCLSLNTGLIFYETRILIRPREVKDKSFSFVHAIDSCSNGYLHLICSDLDNACPQQYAFSDNIKHLELPPAVVQIVNMTALGQDILIDLHVSRGVALYVLLDAGTVEGKFENNGLILPPGKTYTIRFYTSASVQDVRKEIFVDWMQRTDATRQMTALI